MEVLVIVLSSLMVLLTPAGFVGDRLIEKQIRKQLVDAEQLYVRIDTAPTHQILGGKVDRIRIAGRGLFPLKDVRIEALEVESDIINLDASQVRRGKFGLTKPLATGVRIVIKTEDVVRALLSPTTVKQLRDAGTSVLDEKEARRARRYEIINPQIEFLGDQRLRVQVQIRETGDPATLDIFAETGLEIIDRRRLQLVDPIIRLNDKPVTPELLRSIVEGIRDRYDLQQLGVSGYTVRILKFKLDRQQLEIAAFFQIAPNAKFNLPRLR